jgi:hypothetical protein
MWKSDYAQVKGTYIFLFDLNITISYAVGGKTF